MEFIAADRYGTEISYLHHFNSLDMDIGDTNDFSLSLSLDDWEDSPFTFGHRIFCPETEYGGIIEEYRTSTKNNTLELLGYTWRGLLSQKILEPSSGQSSLTVRGEANAVIRDILSNHFKISDTHHLFVVSDINSSINLQYTFEPYQNMLDGITDMLKTVNARLNLVYKQSNFNDPGYVFVSAVPIIDYSEDLEFSQDHQIHFNTRDDRKGINHLICMNKEEGANRLIIHLYTNEDGSITKAKYYSGLDERTSVHEESSAKTTQELTEKGIEVLLKLGNTTDFELSAEDIHMELGDIVGGRERITGLVIKKPVTNKILKISDTTENIEYKVGD